MLLFVFTFLNVKNEFTVHTLLSSAIRSFSMRTYPCRMDTLEQYPNPTKLNGGQGLKA